jgi:hypothetical protein
LAGGVCACTAAAPVNSATDEAHATGVSRTAGTAPLALEFWGCFICLLATFEARTGASDNAINTLFN